MAFRIAVYEQEKAKRATIHDCLAHYSFQHNLEYEVLWLQSVMDVRQQEQYLPTVQLALISLDLSGARAMGEALYRLNPEARIYYYRSKLCNLEPLLPTRPVNFCAWTGAEAETELFAAKLDAVFRDIFTAPGILRVDTRTGLYLLDKRRISYLQSDLKYVIIHLADGDEIRIFRRLSDMEGDMGRAFVRIHKRYIVNSLRVRCFDKSRRVVLMDDGEELPVSESQYDQALAGLKRE